MSRCVSRRVWGVLSLLWPLIVPLSGCNAPPTADVITIEAGEYDEAFAAAVETARRHGLTARLRDRRHGLIETNPAIAASLLEPWYEVGIGLDRRTQQTLSFVRRHARFEFTPASALVSEPPSGRLEGPDVLGVRDVLPDLTAHGGSMELRVWIYVERAHNPGVRRNTWSRKLTTVSRVMDPSDGEPLPRVFWTPVSRDMEFERQILAEVIETIGSGRSYGNDETP